MDQFTCIGICYLISAKLLQASGDATGSSGVSQVLAQRQPGAFPECGLLPLDGGHRERGTLGAAHSGPFDKNPKCSRVGLLPFVGMVTGSSRCCHFHEQASKSLHLKCSF